MARHLTEDEIRYTVDLESANAQKKIQALETSLKGYEKESAKYMNQLQKLELANKKDTKVYQEKKKTYDDLQKKIRSLKKDIADETAKVNLNAKTMTQLRKEAKLLQRQLDNTSKALNPELYAKLQTQISQVTERMADLRRDTISVKETLMSDQAFGTLAGNFFFKLAETIGHSLGSFKELVDGSIELAKTSDGVKKAFRDLDSPGLLDNLRKSTKGTVSDFELMKAAVQAKDFRIPLEDLGKLLSFAQLKAQQTGMSVDYMTNSIVTGLGRKSVMILDNLGISAAEIKENMAKTGDFAAAVAQIVDGQLAAAGETYISAADKAMQRTTELKNAQDALGEELLPVAEEMEEAFGTIQVSMLKSIQYLVKHRDIVKLATIAIAGLSVTTLIANNSIVAYLTSSKAASIVTSIWSTTVKTFQGTMALCSLGIAKLTGNTQKATAAMNAFKAAGKANVFGAFITLLTIAASALAILKNRTSAAAQAQKALNDIKEKAVEKYTEEKGRIDNLIATLDSSTTSLSAKKKAIEELNSIIPGYNARLDETTGKYVANKKALDSYLASLAKKYELEGAREMLADLGKDIARATIELDKAEKVAKETKQRNEASANAGWYGTSGTMYTKSAETLYNDRSVKKAEKNLSRLKSQRDTILGKYGSSLYSSESKQEKKDEPKIEEPKKKKTGSSKTDTVGAEQKKAFEAERKEALANQEKLYAESMELLKRSLVERKLTQEQYDSQMSALDIANADAVLRIEKTYTEKSALLVIKSGEDKKAVIAAQQANEEKARQTFEAKSLEGAKLYYAAMDKLSDEGMTEREKESQEYELRLAALQGYYETALQYARAHGEDEVTVADAYMKARAKIVDDHEKAQLNKQKAMHKQLGLSTIEEDLQDTLAELDAQHSTGEVSEKDYEQRKLNIVKEFEDKKLQVRQQYGLVRSAELYQQQLDQLKQALDQGMLTQEQYEDALQNMKKDKWKETFDYYNNLFGNAVTALMDAEMANVDAKYDAEIEAAEGNSEKVEELETKKANEKLKIEKKYADVNFAVKASQIVADTATSIMKAYADLGPVAGTVAAVLMGVTGAAQLAAANAERQKVKRMSLSGSSSSTATSGARVATGLADGGYVDVEREQDGRQFHAAFDPDKRGYIDRPTVIVGEGAAGQSKEWVASNAALSNPTVAPLIDIIDRAQRVGEVRTLDMRKYLLQMQKGLAAGGTVSGGSVSAVPMPAGDSAVTKRLVDVLQRIEENGIPAIVGIDEFDARQQLRNQSRKIGSK